jgi:hypothetical protein
VIAVTRFGGSGMIRRVGRSHNTNPPTAPSAPLLVLKAATWQIPALADRRRRHSVIASLTNCTKCGDFCEAVSSWAFLSACFRSLYSYSA